MIRLLLLHREIGMEILTKAFEEAEQAQIYRYEQVYEIIQKKKNPAKTFKRYQKRKRPRVSSNSKYKPGIQRNMGN